MEKFEKFLTENVNTIGDKWSCENIDSVVIAPENR